MIVYMIETIMVILLSAILTVMAIAIMAVIVIVIKIKDKLNGKQRTRIFK